MPNFLDLLTPQNSQLIIIDHQPQMAFGVQSIDRQALKNNVVALAKSAKTFKVPTTITTVETESFSGHTYPEILAVLPDNKIIERTSMNSWDDDTFVAAVKATGRKKLLLTGLWTETCIALPTIQAIHDGYEVYVVEDCCGDVNQLSHDNAMKRMIQAGATPVTALSVMLELQRDWAHKGTYHGVMDIVKAHFGAYGAGVEYATTMVHGRPQSTLPSDTVAAGAHR